MSIDHPLTHGGAHGTRGGATKPRGGAHGAKGGATKPRGGARGTKNGRAATKRAQRGPRLRRRSTATPRARRRLAALAGARARLLLVAVAVALLLGGGWLWLRDSSLVRVTKVQVTGVTSSAEPRIDAALDAAARGMTTMNPDLDALRRSVASFPSVAGLSVHTDFPHGMTIEVDERRPVAAIVVGEQRIAVTGDGRLLRDVQDTMGLPALTLSTLPSAERIEGGKARAALAVAAAAPPELRRAAEAIRYGDRGLEAELADGPPLIFGTPDHAAAKWQAAARVLADSSSAGATYLDLRVPGRVAAGGLDPVVAEDAQDDAVQPGETAVATPTPTAAPYSQP